MQQKITMISFDKREERAFEVFTRLLNSTYAGAGSYDDFRTIAERSYGMVDAFEKVSEDKRCESNQLQLVEENGEDDVL